MRKTGRNLEDGKIRIDEEKKEKSESALFVGYISGQGRR